MPHYSDWNGSKHDLSVKQRQAVKTLSRLTIHGWSPTKQIDAIRSWLEYGPDKTAFRGCIPTDRCVTAIADELRINVKSNSFRNAIKKYNWKKPAKI